jgi:uncharacterized protein (TIGR03435 family)
MIHHALWSEAWTVALVNHLWQSTLFILIAWLITLLLRNYQARARYWIWMIASAKFLIPFSILIDAGEFLRTLSGTQVQSSALTAAMEQIVQQPFLQTSSSTITIFNNKTPTMTAGSVNPLALLLPAVWLCGFLAVVIWWARNWVRIRREARLSTKAGLAGKLPILISRQLLEPAVFGIFRPVLLLPAEIKDHLSELQLNAIVAHEMCHVGRRDNLTMAIHMIVQSVFWFHPAVWWIKARLMDERERACDEAVLQSGAKAQLYAESILKVCRFCVESSLACASGVSGSDLKQRIVRIMAGQIARRLDFSKKLLLSMVGIAVLALPIFAGLSHAVQVHAQATAEKPAGDTAGKSFISITPPTPGSDAEPSPDTAYVPTMTFDVASVRESKIDPARGFFMGGGFSPENSSHIRLTNHSLPNLLTWAYGVDFRQIEGIPRESVWTMFNVEAKSDSATDERLTKLTKEQVRLEQEHMLQVLLAERFKLKAHWETRNDETYNLVVAKAGRLKATGAPPSPEELKNFGDRPIPPLYQHGDSRRGFEYTAHGATTKDIAQMLSLQFGRPVADKTGLTGKYDFNLKTYLVRLGDRKDDEPNPWPPLETAIQDELGLKLVPSQGPVRKLIIDHIEKPSEN